MTFSIFLSLSDCLVQSTLGGTTRNRTGDTRIFSPLLYQLSYGTICFATVFLNCECKGRTFLSNSQIFSRENVYIPFFYCTFALALRQSGCSAVGSALRSGRRGRAFESPHPDHKQKAGLLHRKSAFFCFLS